jgi:CBS domain-containing protein
MPGTVADVMTKDPLVMDADAPLTEAARAMRDADIGDVIVRDGGTIGIATDRDIVVRAVAERKDPTRTPLREVFSTGVEAVSPDTPVDEVVRRMREGAIRRVPVVEGGQPVGIVSLGDLAMQQDPTSALADISEAPAND